MKTSKAKVFVSEFLGKCASVVGYFLGVFGPIMTVFELAAILRMFCGEKLLFTAKHAGNDVYLVA